MAEIDTQIAEVKTLVQNIASDTKKTAEQALADVKAQGVVTQEVKDQADKLMLSLTEARESLKNLEARQLEIEQKGTKKPEDDAPKTLGQAVVSDAAFQTWQAGGARGAHKIDIEHAITTGAGSAGPIIAPNREAGIQALPRRRMRIRDLLTAVGTSSPVIQYSRMTERTNAARVVSETTLKPQSNYVWALAEVNARTIAHWIPISRQALADAVQLRGEIDSELRYGLDVAEEEELLNGDGTGQHLSGLMVNATAFDPAFEPDNNTRIDTLRLAVLQLELAEVEFDGAILNPIDWTRIELTKDGEGRYLFANPLQIQGPSLWGRPVVSTAAMDADDFMVGAFMAAATIYDREGATVLFSTEDQDNFVKNMVTALAEKRLALAVKRPYALVKGDFSAITYP